MWQLENYYPGLRDRLALRKGKAKAKAKGKAAAPVEEEEAHLTIAEVMFQVDMSQKTLSTPPKCQKVMCFYFYHFFLIAK